MKLSRRDFIKSNAAAAAAASVGLPLAAPVAEAAGQQIRWDKAPCRFCGTGCSVLVGTKDGRIVATQGDPDAPVNKGLNCIKGYFLSKIVYGDDRVKTPLLRPERCDGCGACIPACPTSAITLQAMTVSSEEAA